MPSSSRLLLATLAGSAALLAPRATAAQDRTFCRAESAGGKGYVVERIAGQVYCLANEGDMTVFLATDSGVVVVDAPPGLVDLYRPAIREVTRAPITHVVYSHSHLDHLGGASRLPAGVVRIAHEETARTLERRNDPRRPLPTRTFAVADTVTLAGATLILRHYGPTHDLGQILAYAPAERVLVGIDLFNTSAPWFRAGAAKDVPAYLALHDSILAYDFDVFVGGHGARTGTRRDLELQREYLWDVLAAADTAAAEVDFASSTAVLPATAPVYEKLAKLYGDQAERCAERVLAKWRGRLPGVEVATPSHCGAMLESRRVD